MDYYPLFIDLRNKPVLVIGDYRVLKFKIEKLLEAGAKILLFSNFLPDQLEQYIVNGQIKLIENKFDEKYLENIWLVICGTDDEKLKKRIAKATEAKNIFCNFVDKAPISSFISPSVVSKGDITIAISTKGKSPALNKYIKNKIMNEIGDEYVYLANILGKMRERVINYIPAQNERSEIFDSLVQNENVLDLIRKNKLIDAENLIKELIDKEICRQNSKEN